ncbi:MAG TPA: hypothetical protein VK487_08835 [Candidatus Bathyarchaeia archaeon]|nr:hypothetical protein [Candidatus Bathyarchaeia archaeon]
MNLEKIRSKKSLKLVTLLLTSLLIASASAATLYGMNITGNVTVSAAKVIWVKGTNGNVTTTISGSSATVDLTVVNGTAQNFTDCLYLENLAAHSYTVNFTTITPLPGASFSTSKMLIYTNATGAYLSSLDLATAGATSNNNLLPNGADGVYSLIFEIVAASNANSNSFSVRVTYQ